MFSTFSNSGKVVRLPTARLPRSGALPRPYCFGVERTVRDTWYEASAARQAAGQVPDDEQAQDCMKKTVRALAILSDQMLKGFPDSEITTTAFMTLTLAREALYNAQPRGMTWWLS